MPDVLDTGFDHVPTREPLPWLHPPLWAPVTGGCMIDVADALRGVCIQLTE